MAERMQSVDLDSSNDNGLERNRPVGDGGFPFMSWFLNDSQRGQIIEKILNEDDKEQVSSFHREPSIEVEEGDQRAVLPNLKSIKPFHCQQCDKQFVTKDNLNRHLLSQHVDEETKKKLHDSRKFKCTFPNCNAKFPSKSKIENHFYSHSTKKEFQCPTCEKFFQTPKSRLQHSKVHKAK